MSRNNYIQDMVDEIIDTENKGERKELLYQLLKDLNSVIESFESEISYAGFQTSRGSEVTDSC